MKLSYKYSIFAIIAIIFLFFRLNFAIHSIGILENELKTLSIASSFFPFGIIKHCFINDIFPSIYHFFLHIVLIFSKNEIFIRIINSFFALTSVFVFYFIGKKIHSSALGLFLAIFLSINHFYFYYTNLIDSISFDFLILSFLLFYLISFIQNRSGVDLKYLSVCNFIYVISSKYGAIFVLSETLVLYLIFGKYNHLKKNLLKLNYRFILSFFVIAPFLIANLINYYKILIPNNLNAVALNFQSFYLLINDFFSPFLTFDYLFSQEKNIFGMFCMLFFNFDVGNINTIKILFALFYCSILPITLCIFFVYKSCVLDKKLKILFLIASLNLAFVLVLVYFDKLILNPTIAISFFYILVILLGYGIFSVKDIALKLIIVFYFVILQFINPQISVPNIVLEKKSPTINLFNNLIKQDVIKNDDLIFMPYLGKFAKLLYKKYRFFDFDYFYLAKKNEIVNNLVEKNAKSINKYNIYYLLLDYISSGYNNMYLEEYFAQKTIDVDFERIVLFVDKMNTKPVSFLSIQKAGEIKDYNISPRKVDFKKQNQSKNDTKIFFEALRTKTLYSFINILLKSYYVVEILEYKKIDNNYYLLPKKKENMYQILNSFDSDYVLIIFKKISE